MCTLFIQWRNVWLRKNILLLIKFIRKCTAKWLSIVLLLVFVCACGFSSLLLLSHAYAAYIFSLVFQFTFSAVMMLCLCACAPFGFVWVWAFKKRNCMQFTITGNGIYNFLSHFFARIAVDFYNSHTNKKASDFAICSKHLHTFVYAVDVLCTLYIL